MKFGRGIIISLILVAVILVAGCTGKQPSGTGGGSGFTVTLTEIAESVPQLTFTKPTVSYDFYRLEQRKCGESDWEVTPLNEKINPNVFTIGIGALEKGACYEFRLNAIKGSSVVQTATPEILRYDVGGGSSGITLTASHTPAAPAEGGTVTITATATTPAELREIYIEVNSVASGLRNQRCPSSPCTLTLSNVGTAKYEYYAQADAEDDSRATTEKKSFTPTKAVTPVQPTIPTTLPTTPTTPQPTITLKCTTKPTLTLSKTSWNAGEEVIATATTNDPNCARKEVYFALAGNLNIAGLRLACAEVGGLAIVTADKNGNAQCTFKSMTSATFSGGARGYIRAAYVTTAYYGTIDSFAGNLISNPVQVTVS